MNNNVVSFNRDEQNDLMTIQELILKHGFKKGYLYKIAKEPNNGVGVYPRGQLKLSEKEVLTHENKKAQKYGRN